MVTTTDILHYASKNGQFTRKNLIVYLESLHHTVSPNAVWLQLNRLVENGELKRVARGVYSLSSSSRSFTTFMSDEIKTLNKQIKAQFPFLSYCVWNSNDIVRYMRHIPNFNYIYVDTARDTVESVFDYISSMNAKRVFLMPDKEEYDRYISGTEAIIVRPLLSEAPMKLLEGFNIPTIEKILVDMAGDVEFSFMQGSEINYFYANIKEQHKINERKLLRYASRRGRKEEVERLWNNII
ncbi:MAG: type IV toxin-antitoxin system AbiEi family antitoxin domain-containing protein [Prevotellaceae bacterium]|jgi:predicted transcriptional regulator of viral defense system|nr:type IV toxin-antitoxin system AbiEi family antitoxin domain-containing protein [Prevotellaceae bacterium]